MELALFGSGGSYYWRMWGGLGFLPNIFVLVPGFFGCFFKDVELVQFGTGGIRGECWGGGEVGRRDGNYLEESNKSTAGLTRKGNPVKKESRLDIVASRLV